MLTSKAVLYFFAHNPRGYLYGYEYWLKVLNTLSGSKISNLVTHLREWPEKIADISQRHQLVSLGNDVCGTPAQIPY